MHNMEPKSKIEALMELVSEMKRLQGEDAAGKPRAVEVEISAKKLDPEELESLSQNGLEEDHDLPSEDDEEMDDMEIPEGLMKLLADKLHK